MSNRIRGGRHGFTLVELLVVLAILAVLSGMIFSATGGVREKARQSVCMGKMRQIGMAIQMYRQDYGGSDTPAPPFEMGFPHTYLFLNQVHNSQGATYLSGSDELFHCPSTSPEMRNYFRDAPHWGNYNYQIWGRTPDEAPLPGLPSFPVAIEKRGDRFPLLADTNHDHQREDRPRNQRYVLVYRLDGSVKGRTAPLGENSWQW